ncbi:zf-HC2 domain-containing protein [candidate division KSB1 bacterium]|nr:zf-HC2 domain-containing protein [candidate division KSB1 bacterium]
MFCEKYADLGILYLYDELEDNEKQSFEKHLADCRHCQAELTHLQESKTLTELLPSDDIDPNFYRELVMLPESSYDLRAKYRQIFADFFESIFLTRRRFVFLPAVAILFCFMLVYLFKPSASNQSEMLYAWDSGWEESFDRLEQKIARFKSDYSSTQTDFSGETSDYSADKVDSDNRLEQIEADIQSLSNELNHSNF